MIIDEETYEVEHHGVKGMRWGVRKNRNSSNKTPWSTKKKVGVGVGIAAAVVTTAAVAIFLKKYGRTPFKSIPKASGESLKFIEEFGKKVVTANPTSVMHSSRGKYTGFKILHDGGLMSPLSAIDKVFGNGDPSVGSFKKTVDGVVGVVFDDPRGRKDAAGRVIPHLVVIPKNQASGIDSFEKASKAAWSLVKDSYESHWASSLKPRY